MYGVLEIFGRAHPGEKINRIRIAGGVEQTVDKTVPPHKKACAGTPIFRFPKFLRGNVQRRSAEVPDEKCRNSGIPGGDSPLLPMRTVAASNIDTPDEDKRRKASVYHRSTSPCVCGAVMVFWMNSRLSHRFSGRYRISMYLCACRESRQSGCCCT